MILVKGKGKYRSLKMLMIFNNSFSTIIAFSFSVNAQENKVDPNKDAITLAGEKDAKDLGEFLDLDDNLIAEYSNIFTQKHKELSEDLSDERKEVLFVYYKRLLLDGLNKDQQIKLKKNNELYKRLCSK